MTIHHWNRLFVLFWVAFFLFYSFLFADGSRIQPTSILRGSRGRGGPLRPFGQTVLSGSCPNSPRLDRCMLLPEPRLPSPGFLSVTLSVLLLSAQILPISAISQYDLYDMLLTSNVIFYIKYLKYFGDLKYSDTLGESSFASPAASLMILISFSPILTFDLYHWPQFVASVAECWVSLEWEINLFIIICMYN